MRFSFNLQETLLEIAEVPSKWDPVRRSPLACFLSLLFMGRALSQVKLALDKNLGVNWWPGFSFWCLQFCRGLKLGESIDIVEETDEEHMCNMM